MGETWKVRVEGSARRPFKYHATFIWGERGAPPSPLVPLRGDLSISAKLGGGPCGPPSPLVPADLYAEGDLAAYLEDCGAELKDIVVLLESLEMTPDAEIRVTPPEELLEVLWAR